MKVYKRQKCKKDIYLFAFYHLTCFPFCDLNPTPPALKDVLVEESTAISLAVGEMTVAVVEGSSTV